MTDEFGEIILKNPEVYITAGRFDNPCMRLDMEYVVEELKRLKERLNTLDMWNGDCVAVLTNLKPGRYALDESCGLPGFMPWDEAVDYYCEIGDMAIPVTVKNGYYEME